MRRTIVRWGVAIALLLLLAGTASGWDRRVRIGGIGVSGTYATGPAWWGPYAYSPWGPAWWDPFWYGGWAHPGFQHGFTYGPGMGQVRLSSAPKDAMVYLDGAYAGTGEKLKSMWLEPGAYDLELRRGDKIWQKRIYVLSGRNLQLKPELSR